MFFKKLSAVILLIFATVFSLKAGEIHIGAGQQFVNIQAAAGTSKPGDTVFLHAGNYAVYQGMTNFKGTANNWITIRPFKNDAIEINGMWQFMKCEYVRFENLVFKSNSANKGRLLIIDNGGSCETQSHHIIIDSCSFMNVTDPANSALKFAGVDTFEVRNCVFKDIASGAMDYNSCHAGLISGNRIENCLTGGHIKGGAANITMERNFFLNASQTGWVAFELGGDTGTPYYCPGSKAEVDSLKFYSNVIVGGHRGLSLASAQNCEVINNTFYECGQATMRFLTTSNTFPKLSGNRVENNIFAFGAASQYMNGGVQTADAATFKNNIYYSTVSPTFSGPYWDSPALDAIKDKSGMNLGSQTPMFVNAAAYDFHLKEGSPAIAAGFSTGALLRKQFCPQSEENRHLSGIDRHRYTQERPYPQEFSPCLKHSGDC